MYLLAQFETMLQVVQFGGPAYDALTREVVVVRCGEQKDAIDSSQRQEP